jgi:uncharacterized protein
MNEHHLALTQQAYAAALGGAYEDFLALLDDEVLIRLPPSLPHGGTYHGKEGALELRRRLLNAWNAFGVEVLEYLTGTESVIGLIRLRGTLTATRNAVDMHIAEYWRYRAGKVIELSAYYFDTHAVVELVQGGDVQH